MPVGPAGGLRVGRIGKLRPLRPPSQASPRPIGRAGVPNPEPHIPRPASRVDLSPNDPYNSIAMYEARLRGSLPHVRERIEAALRRVGRRDEVTVVAVTKGHPPSAAAAAIEAGLRVCGENRVQELEAKVEAVGRQAVEWHLIGHLQRNKVERALPLFDMIESIDSLRLARALSAGAEAAGLEQVRGLVEVNVSGEATKGGFASGAALDAIAEICALPRLRIEGLMTMAPLAADEGVVRATFAGARALFERCGAELPGFQAVSLSMGMSSDFEVAVEEGSTLVRLGTILFGERVT